jgi:5-methylcytosine-specific restriction endonuclease McrA
MASPRGWNARRRKQLRAIVTARDGNICWLCGKPITGQVSLDHVVPRSKGGSDSVDNLRPACLSCNIARGNRMRSQRTITTVTTITDW